VKFRSHVRISLQVSPLRMRKFNADGVRTASRTQRDFEFVHSYSKVVQRPWFRSDSAATAMEIAGEQQTPTHERMRRASRRAATTTQFRGERRRGSAPTRGSSTNEDSRWEGSGSCDCWG